MFRTKTRTVKPKVAGSSLSASGQRLRKRVLSQPTDPSAGASQAQNVARKRTLAQRKTQTQRKAQAQAGNVAKATPAARPTRQPRQRGWRATFRGLRRGGAGR